MHQNARALDSLDRTHLKIVAISVAAGIAVVLIGITARMSDPEYSASVREQLEKPRLEELQKRSNCATCTFQNVP